MDRATSARLATSPPTRPRPASTCRAAAAHPHSTRAGPPRAPAPGKAALTALPLVFQVAVSLVWCRGEAPLRNNCAPAEANCSLAYPGLAADCHCAVDKATVVSVPAHEAWPAEAQAVVDAAGARGGGVGLGGLGKTGVGLADE
mmetsp:Transcript_47268/g.156703  ORF Transcript_47268/g.156703 Transcript_47268/m.156703 type:complete len:144 (-) Transcript_47268:22-453(-)